uniref:Uncharacterized protein n=1 Tax=Tanacetum cinerariifolium TaxID=118510 RepID=A0A6L2ND23_TANCI|nr:hypothetical protein [Tanacetum cinerariifolium]
MDIEIEQDDLNQKFLTSLAPDWLMDTIVWRNRSDLDTMSLDDLYNHLKVYEPEVQKKPESNSQNMAFISSAKNISGKEDVNTASIPTASTNVSPASVNIRAVSISQDTTCAYIASQYSGSQIKIEDITQIDEDDIEEMDIKWNMALLSMRADIFWKKTWKKISIQGTDIFMENEEKDHALVADEEAPTEFALMAKTNADSETGIPEFANDTVTDYNRPSPAIESTFDDAQNRNPFVPETEASPSTISSKPFIKFVKAADPPTVAKLDKKKLLGSLLLNMLNYIENLQRGNKSYLSDYEPFDGGYVSFGQRGCKITGKGTIKTGKLEFENVYFVKDLKYNLFSVSQICHNKNSVLFTDSKCIVLGREFKLIDDTNVLLKTPRHHNIYSIDLNNIVPHKDLTCLVAKASADKCMLWHRRLCHLNFKTMNKLVRHNLVKGLPTKCFENDHNCTACLKGKQHKASSKTKLVKSVTKPFHTLHMDLFGPTSVSSLNHKWYCLVVIDDFSRFTWTFFLKTEDETSGILRNFITEIENLKELRVKIISVTMRNGVAKRRNRTLIEAARTMLADAKLPVTFWAEVVNTACYVQNRVLVNKSQNKTSYELFNSRTPTIGFLKPFGCHVMILNTLDNLGKFEAKGDEGYFIGYSMSSKSFRVFNKRIKRVEENLHVDFLENKPIKKGTGPNWLFDIDSLTNSMNYVPVVVAGTNSTNFLGTKEAARQDVKKDVSSLRYIVLPDWSHKTHLESSTSNAQDTYSADASESSGNSNPTATLTNPPADHIETLAVETLIPTVSSLVLTACLNDSPEPSSDKRLISKRVTSQDDTPSLDNTLTLTNRFEDILRVTTNTDDTNRVEADLGNMVTTITASPTPTLKIHKDHPKKPKKIFDALQDLSWVEAMQEELLQFKIHNIWSLVDCPKKEEWIDYDEVFAPVARIEAIRLFLAYASFMGFTVYQMYVKSAFLYGTIDEKVGTIDQTLFIRRHRGDFILVQIYVDDIIFGSSNPQLCREFKALMHEKFQISAMGELNFFLGLQVLQKEDGIFLSQEKYVGDILKKFGYSNVRSSNTPMDKENP